MYHSRILKKFLILSLLLLLSASAWAARLPFFTPANLVVLGVAAPAATGIAGLTHFAIQTTGIATDVFKIQVSIDGVTFEDLLTVSANGIIQVDGAFYYVKAAKVSGSGTTAKIIMMGVEQ
jgi:hypothetical protein